MAIDFTGMFTGKRPESPTANISGLNPGAQIALAGMQQGEDRARQGIGQLTGRDMRTAGQKVQEQLASLDITKPAGQQQAVQLISKIDPARALELQTKFQQQNAEISKTKQSTKESDRSALLEQQKADTQEKRVDAEIKAAGVAKKETIEVERYDPVTNQNITEFRLKSNPTVVVSSMVSPKDALKVSVAAQKQAAEAGLKAREYGNMALKAGRTANLLRANPPTGGLVGTFEDYLKNITGSQDEASFARTSVTNLINGQAVVNLPRGPASDKDIALVLAGEPPAGANAEYLANYAQGIIKLAKREEKYYRDQARWIDSHGSILGFQTSQNIKTNKETLSGVNGNILAAMRASYGTPEEEGNALLFQNKYGFNLKELDGEMSADEAALADRGER